MSLTCRQSLRGQQGIALISALLLLLVITILGLSMFRTFPTQEKIAGNVREKERALHAANSAQQFAEYWLLSNVATGDVVCGAQAQLLNANLAIPQGQICSNALYTYPAPGTGLVTDVTKVPWIVGGAPIGVQYIPNGMTVTGNPIATPGDSAYISAPVFSLADLGGAGDAQGEAYQIDAYAYGGSTSTVAVVESIYEVQQGVVNRGGE